ncbi:hypothetical protein HanRHA438_Chr13g0606441 [Helianthus annuus]|uniref:Uncharacterized protein n=1 Tax=Helianthus annuus TaxID=4232 RepID=A0A9K3HBD7_HELAN|nr:hypothetical protein HanXRQr2_Chr13g0595701 [Helianthus annuus]KAJ0481913.1 hypothetical protein HanIR_Chr13g0648111 [Helianthus annuus]KAJ0849852.1 hypothetical protein HanPSC8_Chr13g0573751 [Helianthus annuus]KAJ0858901.1 hypothetical protein HanRHA438_Chr13g0606441 [Helianthus annuus]
MGICQFSMKLQALKRITRHQFIIKAVAARLVLATGFIHLLLLLYIFAASFIQ